jgi:hypothetical protein
MIIGKDTTTAQDQIKERLKKEQEARERNSRGRSTSPGSKGKSRVASPRPEHPDDKRRRKEEEEDRKKMKEHRKLKGEPKWENNQGVSDWLDQDDKDNYMDTKDGRDVEAQAEKTRKELDAVDKDLEDIISKREEKKAGGGEANKDGDQAEEEQLKKVRETLENLRKVGKKEQIAKIQAKLDKLAPGGTQKAEEEQKKKDDDERKKRADNGEKILSDDDQAEDEFFREGPEMPESPRATSKGMFFSSRHHRRNQKLNSTRIKERTT